ncbi:hypothetical protein PSY17_23030, partial [Shigella flexneri]|nr:hypothetical protein [Shigella flexneri]
MAQFEDTVLRLELSKLFHGDQSDKISRDHSEICFPRGLKIKQKRNPKTTEIKYVLEKSFK